MEAEDKEPDARVTIEHATEAFLQDATARGLRKSSLDKFTPLFRRLKDFAASKGLRYINQLDLDRLREFRATWSAKNFTARNELERLRSLFRFAHDGNWIDSNPATKLKSPRVEAPPSLPFSRDEMAKILHACDESKSDMPLKAFVLVLRHSGLRIRDVVTLSRDKITDGRLFLRTEKTGTQVKIPLPPECLNELEKIPAKSQYYFWSGQGLPKTRVANYQIALKGLFDGAKIVHGFAHRFRDTFACEVLMAGVPIERLAVLLGHSSIRVTERHYSPWVQARQEQLEEDVRRTWTGTVPVGVQSG